jgi:microsomal dipeptidase-like Zn-dependent dipeptidase
LTKLNVIVDLAHASEQTWRDVVEEGIPVLSDARRMHPIIFQRGHHRS